MAYGHEAIRQELMDLILDILLRPDLPEYRTVTSSLDAFGRELSMTPLELVFAVGGVFNDQQRTTSP